MLLYNFKVEWYVPFMAASHAIRGQPFHGAVKYESSILPKHNLTAIAVASSMMRHLDN